MRSTVKVDLTFEPRVRVDLIRIAFPAMFIEPFRKLGD